MTLNSLKQDTLLLTDQINQEQMESLQTSQKKNSALQRKITELSGKVAQNEKLRMEKEYLMQRKIAELSEKVAQNEKLRREKEYLIVQVQRGRIENE